MNWTPHQYQIHAAQHALENPGAGLFLKPGLGKTTIAMAVYDTLSQAKHARGMLVISTLRVAKSVWVKEAAKWAEFSHLKVSPILGSLKARTAALNAKADIYTINVENTAWLFTYLASTKVWPFDILVLDESTKFKNTQSVRHKALLAVMPRFKRVMALTGTPASNRIEDVFGQVRILDGGERLGRFITHFRRNYFDEQRHRMGFSQWFPRADTVERVKDKIKDICLYMSDEDYLAMPKLTLNRVEVELPDDVRADYKALERNFFATIDGKAVSAAHAAAAQMKLRQMVGGQVYGEDGVAQMHTAKLDALQDLVEEASGEPLLIAVSFKHEADAIKAMLKSEFDIDAPYLGDGISAAKTDAIIDQWNAGKLPVVIAHPASVAHGLNLQAGGSTVVWFTLTWSLEDYEQLNRRVYRQGQTKPVMIHHIIAADTVDDKVYDALTAKDADQRGFLNALKRSK